MHFWELFQRTFGTIIDLIKYHETIMLPMDAVFLVCPFEKPKWSILFKIIFNQLINYN